MSEHKFYKCNVCGNLVGLINSGGGVLTCCNQPMELLAPNTVDAAFEKHIPVLEMEGDKLAIKVGSAPHPMLPEHYIMWVFVGTENSGHRISFKPGDEPKALLDLKLEDVTSAYAYCNLHGLWKADL